MQRFQIEQSKTSFFTSHSGLALVGLALNQSTSLKKSLKSIVKRHGISTMDLIRSYVGQLAIGKSDFDHINTVRDDDFFKAALGIQKSPQQHD